MPPLFLIDFGRGCLQSINGKESGAVKHRCDLDAPGPAAVHNPVVTPDHFPQRRLAELGHDAPRFRKQGKTLCRSNDSRGHERTIGGKIPTNEVADRLNVCDCLRRPTVILILSFGPTVML